MTNRQKFASLGGLSCHGHFIYRQTERQTVRRSKIGKLGNSVQNNSAKEALTHKPNWS